MEPFIHRVQDRSPQLSVLLENQRMPQVPSPIISPVHRGFRAVSAHTPRAVRGVVTIALSVVLMMGSPQPVLQGESFNPRDLSRGLVTTHQAQVSSRWMFPCGAPFRMHRAFDPPPTKYAAGHRGIDVLQSDCVEVLAPADGTVSFAGVVAGKPVISIAVDERTVVSYEPVNTSLSKGDVVLRGEPIGTPGTGGHCGSECVHMGVRVDGEYVNPVRFFGQKPALLPLTDDQ